MTDDEEEGITLEEILVEIIDAQIALVDAVSGAAPLADPDDLKVRLHDLRELLEQAVVELDEE